MTHAPGSEPGMLRVGACPRFGRAAPYRVMFAGFVGRNELCAVLFGLLSAVPVGCRKEESSTKPAPPAPVASSTMSIAPDPSPDSPAKAPAPVDSSDPGPIVVAEEPLLDQPIPIDACDTAGFCWVRPTVRDIDLNAIWPFAKNDVWVFGNAGLAMRWDGTRFRDVETFTRDDLVAAWASSPNDLYVLGRGGTLLRFNGKRFETIWQVQNDYAAEQARDKPNAIDLRATPPLAKHPAVQKRFTGELPDKDSVGPRFNDIWGSADGKLWVAGEIETSPPYKFEPAATIGLVRHFDGKTWQSKVWDKFAARTSVWGTSPDDVYAWSDYENVSRYENGVWMGTVKTPAPTDFEELHARNLAPDYGVIWQRRAEDSWVVRHRNGGDLVERVNHRSGKAREGSRLARLPFLKGTVRDIRGTATDDVWLVGKGGLLLHFDGVRWRGTEPPLRAPTEIFEAAWAVAPNDVWFVGTVVVRFDGTAFHLAPRPPGTQALRSVWGEKSDAVWAVTESTVHFFDGAAWSPVSAPEKIRWHKVRGIGSKVWLGGDGRLFVGSKAGFTQVELPQPLAGSHSLLLRSADDALLLGKAAYRWDSRGLARMEPELDALLEETPLGNLASAPGTGIIYGQHKTDFVRVEGAKIVARAETQRGSVDYFAGPGGSFFAGCGEGIVRFEDGSFRFSPLHSSDSTMDVAGDAENVWVLGYRGAILRKRLSPSASPPLTR
jgi:hypothetical protein